MITFNLIDELKSMTKKREYFKNWNKKRKNVDISILGSLDVLSKEKRESN